MVTIKKDLRARFLAARDQGPRPTCLAFALSDAHAAQRPPHPSLSADFLFFHALRRMPSNHGDNGVGLAEATSALGTDGQPLETAWPYSPQLPSDLSRWRPPAKLTVMAATAADHICRLDAVCAQLDQDQPTVLVFLPSERFYLADPFGRLPARTPDSNLPQSHAVVAVGYGTKASRRLILIRNSWGDRWGQKGHAWLEEDYLAPRLSSVTSIQAN